jgi:hypothetical protein
MMPCIRQMAYPPLLPTAERKHGEDHASEGARDNDEIMSSKSDQLMQKTIAIGIGRNKRLNDRIGHETSGLGHQTCPQKRMAEVFTVFLHI